ncbi:MAG: menaquinone biosynthesis protein [Planctomycetota bacterium]|nr:menaquinone biosynthesis protein [Planctomycetota bacterium]
MPETITIGAVPYLNARPLVFGLDQRPQVRLRLELPCDLGRLLARGEVDVALLPAIEYVRLAAEGGERARAGPARLVGLPVAAIGSRGPVGSVRLFGYSDPGRIRRVLLDPASRTSNALGRLIVVRRLGVQPHFVLPDEIGPAPSRPPDAELVMGDRGLVAERPQAKWVHDLGLEWERMIHRPFIYAFWVARADAPLGRVMDVLASSRDAGLAARDQIAAEAPAVCGVPADVARRHLFEQVQYGFGPKEQQGLEVFYRMAAQEGLAPDGVRLEMARTR